MDRRTFLATGAALAVPAWAQGTPAVRKLVVGFPAGGTADSLARALAPLLADAAISYVVDNKSGASGQLAAEAVRQAVPDGSSLLLTPSSVLTLVPLLYKKPPFDALRDFAPVACVCDHAFALAVNGNSPITSLAAYIAWARANPEKASYATPGPGSAPHFLGVMLGREIGAPLVHVPYRGVAPGLQDLMGGQVASTVNPVTTMLEYHRAGRIRILAVSNPTRLATLPDVPTFTESRLPALELVEWYGLFAPAKLAPPTLAGVSAQLKRVMQTPELQAAAKRLEVIPRYEDGASLARLLQQDQARWTAQVAATGIQLD
ncbi:tripartite tricarboxylate transporter substrate-binding protein [Pseudorhodoferax sp. LjRoot39]|uniref:tripartite tricarboxylate transporter substrate-binding protein n=1 Tax=Pseudorhodoferax sp. LjRoot39 TaxID=3342328 RepID=UPI003ECFFDF4